MGTRCLKKKREKKQIINKEDFLNPKDIPELFSGTPQYVRLKRELLGWPGARDLRGAPRFSRLTKKFPPRGRYLPILQYSSHSESIGMTLAILAADAADISTWIHQG